MAIFSTLYGQKIPNFDFFPQVPLLTHASRHLGEDFRKFSAKTNDKNWTYKSKTFKKLDFLQKMAIFWHFLAKKIPNFEFSHGYHYPHALEDTQEKTLGSFKPKLMTKIEVTFNLDVRAGLKITPSVLFFSPSQVGE